MLQTFFVSSALADVVAFDDVAPVDSTIQLKALTKGRFFPEGGRVVKFYLDEKIIGTRLSGGDGYAFLNYTPLSSGTKRLKVESDQERGEGIILVAGKTDKLLVIEIESSLVESVLSFKPVKDSAKTVHRLSKDFRIIYLTTLAGEQTSRTWLEENKFPLSPVFKWEGADMFEGWKKKGINLYAIVASPDIISDVPEIEKRFSFSETEDGVEVKDWNDLMKQLDSRTGK